MCIKKSRKFYLPTIKDEEPLYLQYYVLLARFLRGQLQPVVFSLSCSLKSLAKILCIYM
ncbi:hypothetical protein GF586_10265 [Staphylococcus aureus]|nr:hypothetical protein [Staphylococcus aureus]MRW32777.1 hypothetical protein [Staphylococcus aureus]MRW76270.1 hypothetical protein [Staphylococcus aureus]